jgi:three-Cys-motif partner protein
MAPLRAAADGLPARVVSGWSREKLFYIERYLEIFCTGMKDKWSLVYADLLAGPGRCIDESTDLEFPGSPLLALQRPEFRRLYFNDADPDVAAALHERAAGYSGERVRVDSRDCNDAVEVAREFLFPGGMIGGTLGLAVIDPTAFQMRFDALARFVAEARFDLIVVFMSGYLKRFITAPEYAPRMDAFFGTGDWRGLVDLRRAGERVTFRQLLDLYERRLRTLGYLHVDDSARMLNTRRSTIYHLVFASRNPKGAEFFGKINQRSREGQGRLFA